MLILNDVKRKEIEKEKEREKRSHHTVTKKQKQNKPYQKKKTIIVNIKYLTLTQSFSTISRYM